MKARVLPFRQSGGELSDEELLAQIARGASDAEGALIHRYSRGLMVMLFARTRDSSLAQDIHQETFTILLTAAREEKIRQPESLRGFIHRTALNVLLNLRRREQRNPVRISEDDVVRFADGGAGPLAMLESEQVLEQIDQSMAGLSVERDRLLLWRYFVDGVSKKDVCRELRLTAEHFDRVLYRARKRFRTVFESEGNSGESRPR